MSAGNMFFLHSYWNYLVVKLYSACLCNKSHHFGMLCWVSNDTVTINCFLLYFLFFIFDLFIYFLVSLYFFILINLSEHTETDRGCPRGVMVKAMDCGIVVSELVLQSRYYVHFRANTLGKGMNLLILPAMG